ncbi:MAG TPA: addiction module protein [Rhizomicrobium sp.]
MNDLSFLFKLSPAERIQLAEELWDSVAANPEDVPPLTKAQLDEAEQRYAEFEANPSIGVGWADVRARIWSRLK